MNRYVLSIGSNLEPREERIRAALVMTASLGTAERSSGIYETPEIHGGGDPYLNMVLTLESEIGLTELNAALKAIEKESGRDARSRTLGIVPVDIDIVMCNGEVVRPKDFRQRFFQIGWREICQE